MYSSGNLNRLSDETIKSNTASNCSTTPELSYYGTKTRVEFIGICSKQDTATYIHGAIVNIYIAYEISKNYNISSYNISSYPTLENCEKGNFHLVMDLAETV